jgi:K+-sensing histidine kinase KdpD
VLAPHPAAVPVRPSLSGAVGGVLGLPAGAVAALTAWAFAGDHTTGLVFAALAAITLAALTTTIGAAVAACLCWACFDGFVLHRFGTLEASRNDLLALGVVLGAALAVRGVAAAVRYAGTSGRTTEAPRGYAASVLPEAPARIRSLTR